jgi:dsRNA-specific ribonuclease
MKDLLIKIFKRGNLRQEYIDELLLHKNEYQSIVFTSSEFDAEQNYQLFEFLGDSVINTFIPFYFYRRYPQLHCSTGVKVLNRLKANHVSKKSLSSIAERLGFWPHIRCLQSEESNRAALLEDVFEAFFGFTVHLLDEKYMNGVGHGIVYDILKDIFDEIDVSLEYDDLYDAKTRLKELFDKNKALGKFEQRNDDERNITTINYTIVTREGVRKDIILGRSEGEASKSERVQKAAKNALKYLKDIGIVNKGDIQLFCESIRKKETQKNTNKRHRDTNDHGGKRMRRN